MSCVTLLNYTPYRYTYIHTFNKHVPFYAFYQLLPWQIHIYICMYTTKTYAYNIHSYIITMHLVPPLMYYMHIITTPKYQTPPSNS